jgi:hypothetical protein
MTTKELKSPKHKTAVITKETDVPAGYVPIASFREVHGDAMATKMSHAHKDGFVRAVKLMRTADDRGGPVWVHQDDWLAYLKSTEPQQQERLNTQGNPDPIGRNRYDVLEEINTRLDSLEHYSKVGNEYSISILSVLVNIQSILENIERIWSPERKSGT